MSNSISSEKEALPRNQDQENFKGEHLYALLLKLRAQSSGTLLPHAGQLAYGALLHWLAQVDPMFASQLHEPNRRRPFTCSSLWFPNARNSISNQDIPCSIAIMPRHTYWLRFTLLTERLFETFMTRFCQATPSPTHEKDTGPGLPVLRLGEILFDVVEATTTPEGIQGHIATWGRHTTYHELVEQAQRRDFTKTGTRTIELEFCSPTAFSNGQRAGGKQMCLFPEPERVFDSLSRSWNYWAPAHLSLDVQALQAYIQTPSRIVTLPHFWCGHTTRNRK
jgi:CRISPR-associated endoribonuclease Cas6